MIIFIDLLIILSIWSKTKLDSHKTIEGTREGIKISIPSRYRCQRDIQCFLNFFWFKRIFLSDTFKKF